jgi:hypothetical protein
LNDAITRCLGLVTQYNPLQTAAGALIKANDCVINRENLVEDRRGYASYGALADSVVQLLVYSNKIIAHQGSTLSFDNGSGTFTDFSGTYSAPSGCKMRGSEAFSNLYLTTSLGVQVATALSASSGIIRKAGSPRSLDGSYALNAAATGFLANASQCAYRFVIQRTDANSNIINGYPSTRLWVANASGTSKNVDHTLYLPSEVTVNDVIQVYRTEQVSGTGSDSAGDEMALVYQVSPSAGDITNGYITFTDVIVDELRGATLYTSPSQETIAQGNDRPPLCKDLALYKALYMMYANTSTKQRLFITLVGTGSLSGKTLTIAGTTYNFGATEIISGGGSPQAKAYTAGSAAQNIDDTARSLVRVINRYAANTSVYAYYLSGSGDLPGQILVEEKGIGASAFTVLASDTAISGMFFPPPPVGTPNTKSTSSNQVQKNAVYFSKAQQPEAVPSLNYVLAGSANKEILRVVPLKNSLVIIKEEGVYLMTGESSQSFVVTPLDLTVYCKSADSIAVLNNQVFMLSNQGVVAISETGVQVISREIEPNIRPLLAFTNIGTLACGAAYESERSYFLSVPSTNAATSPNQIYVFNIFTRAWTRWTFGFVAALVEQSQDKLYFAKPTSATVYRERKALDDSDYADPETAITITALNAATNTVSFTIVGATPDVGWVISQGSSDLGIQSISLVSGVYTAVLDGDFPASWATDAATIYPSVGMDIIWDAWTGTQPGQIKQVSEFAVLTDNISGNNTATQLTPTFISNFDENSEETDMAPAGGSWGGAWGAIPWGGTGDSYGYRTYVPRNKQICRILNPGVKHKKARERLVVAGCAFVFEMIGERIGR